MKYVIFIVSALLGLLFIASSVVILFHLVPEQPMPEGTPPWHFMSAFAPTGYLTFVKVLELLGGILVVIPLTRNLGLLILGPIIVNILAFHVFLAKTAIYKDPSLIFLIVASVFLLYVERRAFASLVMRGRPVG